MLKIYAPLLTLVLVGVNCAGSQTKAKDDTSAAPAETPAPEAASAPAADPAPSAGDTCADVKCETSAECCKGYSCGFDEERSKVQRYCLPQ